VSIDYDLAEQAVLSAMLHDTSGVATAQAGEALTKDDFSSMDRSSIFETCLQLSPANEVDVIIKHPELQDEVMFISEKYGGGSITRYIDYLIEHRNTRAVEHALFHANDELKANKSAEEISQGFVNRIARSLSQRKGVVACSAASKQAHADFLEVDAGGTQALTTGLSRLDLILQGGFKKGSLYVLAARPGVGKSALAIQFTHECAKRGLRAAYASLEMTANEIAGRLLSSTSGVRKPVSKGFLQANHKQKLEAQVKAMQSWPITFKDDNEATLQSIQAFVSKQRIEGELGLVVIDYLQLLSVPGVDSRVQEISQISRQLKAIAMEFDIPVVALSQLNRALEAQNRNPMLSDLRESGSIEQDADCVMLMHRDEVIDPTKDVIICNVAKNRNGEERASKFLFDKSIGRFSTHVETRLNDKKNPF
jgi:replicative DNA helicase